MNLRFLWAPNTRHCVSNDYSSQIPSEPRVWDSFHGIIYREKPLGNGRQKWFMPRQESIIRLIEAGCCLWIFSSLFSFLDHFYFHLCVCMSVSHMCVGALGVGRRAPRILWSWNYRGGETLSMSAGDAPTGFSGRAANHLVIPTALVLALYEPISPSTEMSIGEMMSSQTIGN